ncbi:MAG TPA: GspH/FimT family pseudopilin [Candidatus Limnocylindria bacterium]|nr:GspH/FimT family pseudopilin [Candidatus Limnocylindria bacterium]
MSRRAGFTLLELTLVLMIMAIAIALVGPAIEGGFDSREVRRAARQIASTMHHLRGEAVATGHPTAMRIDQHENTIETVGGGRWAVLTDRAVIEAVSGAIRVGDEVWDIRFYPNGANTGAQVVLANSRDRTRNRLLVTLDPLLGTITVGDAPL